MEKFRNYLRQELLRRTTKNSSYSLRSFAKSLKLNHATLSSLMSGKRKMTDATVQKLGHALNLSPADISKLTSDRKQDQKTINYFLLQQDVFSVMSEWYFDAILELSIIPHFKMKPDIISKSIGISTIQAKIALETLERLGLLMKDSEGKLKLRYQNSSNVLDPDFTSVANRKYQKSVLQKSLEAIDRYDRTNRDHTSTTMAINVADLPKAKELIRKFRHDINSFLQNTDAEPNEVYQLQISFFPLSENSKL